MIAGEKRFASSAASLAGMMGALFGWRPDAFWNATPSEISSILQVLAGESDHAFAATCADLARLKEMIPDG